MIGIPIIPAIIFPDTLAMRAYEHKLLRIDEQADNAIRR
jgi:hypothetical protein